MTEIEVNPQELLTAASRIQNALPTIENLANHLPLGSGTTASGRPDVANAIDAFLDRWRSGLGHLGHDAEHLASLLQKAGEAYARVDREIGEAAG